MVINKRSESRQYADIENYQDLIDSGVLEYANKVIFNDFGLSLEPGPEGISVHAYGGPVTTGNDEISRNHLIKKLEAAHCRANEKKHEAALFENAGNLRHQAAMTEHGITLSNLIHELNNEEL